MSDAQFTEMNKFCDEYDSLPDGAFFQLAEDMHGWTVDDWAAFSEREKKDAL